MPTGRPTREPLPVHWASALERFRASDFAREYFGKPFAQLYATVKQGELDAVQQLRLAARDRLVHGPALSGRHEPWAAPPTSIPTTPTRRRPSPRAPRSRAASSATSAWSAAASPAARPRCTSRSAAIPSCCSRNDRIGWGASGRSGAQALFGVAAGQAKLERLVGAADARRIWDVTVEGLALQRELIARHGIDCDYVAGQMHVAIKPRQDEELRAEVQELHERYDYRSIRLRRRARSCARWSRASATPPAPTTRTAATCIRSTTRSGWPPPPSAPACGSSRRAALPPGTAPDGRLRVATARGEVRCRQLALCGNAWLGSTAPALARRIMAGGHLHRRHRTAGRGARPRA